ncbi:MAG TPA: glycosyltransferase family 2 protein [Solirubrobacteraceae bacterium]|nr:glycosyltransferase family 2 protein [Solirubrobacteraceae bacterium]
MAAPIDVVIVTYEGYEMTAECLRHLERQTIEHNLIVVDNGSRDGTYARLRAEWPHAHVERFEENHGFPEACNRGVAAGAGEIVVPMNNDVVCEPDFLERLAAPLDDPAVGSSASLLLQPGGALIDSVGMTADAVLAGYPRLHGLPVAHAHDPYPVLTGPMATAGAYRRVAWEQANGLDETIFAYTEDLDLNLRMRSAGWRCALAIDAVGVHLGSATHGHRSARQRRYAGYGRGYMVRRYGLLSSPQTAVRTLSTEAVVVLGDLAISHDAAALRGRLKGWTAGRRRPRHPRPPAAALDLGIGFIDSLSLRRGVYAKRAR